MRLVPLVCFSLLPLVVVAAEPAGSPPHAHDATVRHRFDDAEQWAKVFDDPARDAWQKPDKVVRFLGVRSGQSVADLGAGTGYFTVRLAKAVGASGKVYAVDIEPALVDHIAERARSAGLAQVVPVLAAAADARLPERSVDLVLVVNTWHHIDDRLRYLERLSRALKPGGRIAIVDFREGDLPVGPPAGHKLHREAILSELAAGGWSLGDEYRKLPYQYVLVFRR
jgi:ubiquinone/menaquinone biosynthesis C-methylase UbiE